MEWLINKTILIGRWTRDIDIRYGREENPICIARGTLAVDRRVKKDDQQNADFISCVAFGKTAEFLEKYGRKGVKMAVEGRIQTGSYKKDAETTVYTTDVVIEQCEFAESKGSEQRDQTPAKASDDGFMNLPEGIDDDELPFN